MATITRLSIIKFLELLLVCILIGLHYNSLYNSIVGDQHTAIITWGTFGGYLIILVGLFIGSVMGTPVNRRVDLFFSLIGCALFIAAGALNIEFFNKFADKSSFRDTGLAKGSISIIEGIVFLVDAFLSVRGEN